MTGLSPAWKGVIQDTASTSSLLALLCARERTTNFSLTRGGLQSEEHPLVVYVSKHAHSSVDKAALLAGFGRANVRAIDVDASFALRGDVLERAIADDRAAGRIPCAIVATTGTTTTTAIDPIGSIATIAQREHLWLHVDAAMAGSAMILPECRWMWDGIEGADSLVVNPHKWLGAAFDCSVYYVKDPEHLVRVMSTNPSYLQSSVDARVTNYRDWGIPLGRRFRALKLWCLIREQGVSGVRARGARGAPLARARSRRAPNRLRAPRTAGHGGRRARPPHASLGRAPERVGLRLRHARDARRPLDGARVDRRARHRARARRRAVEGDARSRGVSRARRVLARSERAATFDGGDGARVSARAPTARRSRGASGSPRSRARGRRDRG
jgi:Pyridoxal-dependent decarboxylase conserved domain